MKSSVYIALVASFAVYFGNEIIIGFIEFQNSHYSKFFGGEHVIIETEQGFLEGFSSTSRDGQTFYEFLGVPYGTPPVGDLRFEPPVKYPKWDGVKEALNYGHKCLQYDFLIRMIVGDEDCLNLNVYSPSTKILDPNSPQKLLPVLVFIYGGMFMFGRTEIYRPEYFMDTDVVLVTINYRLAAFGFLNTGDETVRGNMGLKDQLMAFKWIQENIAAFGGDPNSVTLMGESAGGASIHYHMLSNQSVGLFHRAISMSGTVLNNWAFMKKPKEQATYFGGRVGCPTGNSQELVTCLRQKDAKTIANFFMESRDMLHNRLTAFAPSIEAGTKRDDTFLSEDPKELLKAGKLVTNVPWIIGANDQEGLIYAGDILLNKTCSYMIAKHWFKFAPVVWDYEDAPKTVKKSMSKKLWNFYLRNQPEPLRLHESIRNLTAIFSDINFYKPMRETVGLQANKSTIYLYYYSYPARHGLGQVFMVMSGILPVVLDGVLGQITRWLLYSILGLEEKRWGACHTDELGVIFQLPALINTIKPGSADYGFSKQMVSAITHFATHGEPMEINGTAWPPVDVAQPLQYMLLDKEWNLIPEPFKERVDFVTNLFNDAFES